MELIIAILLWTQSLMPFGHYSATEVDDKVQQNQAIIESVMADPVLQHQVEHDCGAMVPTVVIHD